MSNEDTISIRSTELFKAVYERDIAGRYSRPAEQEEIQELVEQIRAARHDVAFNGANPEEILENDFGLEPDYIFDLMP